MSQRITVLFFCIMAALSKVAMAGPVDENAARNIAAKVEMLRSYERQLAAIADGADVQPCYRAGGTRAVAPLITSKWAQKGQGYNAYCPEDTSLAFLDGHPSVGCITLALAQVMRYWQWPAHGRGEVSYSYSYPCWTYGTLSADFSTVTFDWNNMPDSF